MFVFQLMENLKLLAGKFPNDDHLIVSMAITIKWRLAKLIYVRSKDYLSKTVPGKLTLPWYTIRTWLPAFFSRDMRMDYEHTMFGIKMHWLDAVVIAGLCYSVDDPFSYFHCSIKSITKTSPARQEVLQKR